jgi:hypothetical protein
MRKMLTSLCFILCLGSMLAPDAVQAQPWNNEIGLYTDLSADLSSTSIIVEPNVPFNVYLIVTNPVREEQNPSEIDWVNGCIYRMPIIGSGLYELANIPNGEGIRFLNPQDFTVGFSDPVPVPENRAVLIVTFTFMTVDYDPKLFFLQPAESFAYPNKVLTILPYPGTRVQDVYPVSGDYELPVFGINPGVVATENVSWGGVKALYR